MKCGYCGTTFDDALPHYCFEGRNFLVAENAHLRAIIVAWAKRYQWGADAWKQEPENAALFAIAEEAMR